MVLFGLSDLAFSQQVVYVVCRKHLTEQNCNKCSEYFPVQNEVEAVQKCKTRGYAQSNYSQSEGGIRWWVLFHCNCDDSD